MPTKSGLSVKCTGGERGYAEALECFRRKSNAIYNRAIIRFSKAYSAPNFSPVIF